MFKIIAIVWDVKGCGETSHNITEIGAGFRHQQQQETSKEGWNEARMQAKQRLCCGILSIQFQEIKVVSVALCGVQETNRWSPQPRDFEATEAVWKFASYVAMLQLCGYKYQVCG